MIGTLDLTVPEKPKTPKPDPVQERIKLVRQKITLARDLFTAKRTGPALEVINASSGRSNANTRVAASHTSLCLSAAEDKLIDGASNVRRSIPDPGRD